MSNNELIFKIISEIDRCDAEIRKIDDMIIRMQERRLSCDTRKKMLHDLFDMVEVTPIQTEIDN